MINARQSHSFDVEIACKLGVHAAIIYNHILFWIKHNQIKKYNQHEGKTWMYESIPDIAHYFPYLSEKMVKTAIQSLVGEGLLIEGSFNKNKFDRTTWYSIPNEGLINSSNSSYEEPCRADDGTCRADGKDIQGSCHSIYKDITTDKTHTPPNPQKGEAAKAACEPVPLKISYGENGFVKLTEEEHKNLLKFMSEKERDEMIVDVDLDISKKGEVAFNKKYKSHYSVIQSWHRYRQKQGLNAPGSIDRRTKNKDGTPIQSQWEDKF